MDHVPQHEEPTYVHILEALYSFQDWRFFASPSWYNHTPCKYGLTYFTPSMAPLLFSLLLCLQQLATLWNSLPA